MTYRTTVRLPDRHKEFLSNVDINLSAHVRQLVDDLEKEWETRECDIDGCSNELGLEFARIEGNTQPGQELALGADEEMTMCIDCLQTLVKSMQAPEASDA